MDPDDQEPNGYRIEDPGRRAPRAAGLGDPSIEAAFDVTVADGEVTELRSVYRA